MAQVPDSTKAAGSKTGVSEAEQREMDREAMKIAKAGLKEMHDDEKQVVPGNTIFSK
ncbi:MAG: hypothetical protein ABI286_05295 [Edaphobacter sp.]